MGRLEKGFYARFLGGFSLYYEGQELQVGANLQNISTQILLMLLKAGNGGVEKKELMALIRPEEHDWAKRLNNFRQQIHILRRRIKGSGFPEGEYVVSVGSRYYLSLEQRVETDTACLDRLVGQIRACKARAGRSGKKGLLQLYREYCQAYKGEFLPLLGGEAWVALESAFYQKWYFTCLEALCRDLKREGRYAAALELCTTASQLHPYDEWQAVQIECLLAMGQYKEALEIYEKATELFYKDLGVTSLDRVMERYRETVKETSYMAGALARLKEDLEEKERIDGPYLCSYPSFQDLCRIMIRLGERDGTESQLLLCTLLAGSAGGQDERRMELLQGILTDELRAGDAYTRYSQKQFLVLLAGADGGAGERIVKRLETAWKLYNQDRRARVRFTLERAEGPEAGMADVERLGIEGPDIEGLDIERTGAEGAGYEGMRHEEEGDFRCTYHRPGKLYLARAGDLAGKERDQELSEPAGTDQADGRSCGQRGTRTCMPT